MRSKQVAARYHTGDALGVRFRIGDGQVVHVTGHFFTQPGQPKEVAAAGQAFEQLSRNVVREKELDQPRMEQLYKYSAKDSAELRAEPSATAPAALGVSGGRVKT